MQGKSARRNGGAVSAQKKVQQICGGPRGRRIDSRFKLLTLIDQSAVQGASLLAICRILGLSARTVQRWRQDPEKIDGRVAAAKRRTPANSLTEREREQILRICNQSELSCMPPNQIVPALADEGKYVASESSFYRVLRSAGQSAHRGKGPNHLCIGAPSPLWPMRRTSCAAGI
jgi:putative transposase